MSNVSSLLPNLLGPVVIAAAGAAQPSRATINFAGATASDDGETLTLTPAAATDGAPGSMSAADKTKLDGIQKQGAAVAVSAYAIDWATGGVFTKTLGAGAQVFTFANAASGMVIIVRVTSDAGGSTLTWPTVKWPAGAAPTQTSPSGTDVYTFVHDGTDIYGSVVQAMA